MTQPTDRHGIDQHGDLAWTREQLLAAQMETTEAVTRLERTEAERDMLGRETDRLRKDWVEMRTRAEWAAAALTAVRAECDRIAKLPTVNTTGPCDSFSTGVRWTIRQLHENALDQHGQTPKEPT